MSYSPVLARLYRDWLPEEWSVEDGTINDGYDSRGVGEDACHRAVSELGRSPCPVCGGRMEATYYLKQRRPGLPRFSDAPNPNDWHLFGKCPKCLARHEEMMLPRWWLSAANVLYIAKLEYYEKVAHLMMEEA